MNISLRSTIYLIFLLASGISHAQKTSAPISAKDLRERLNVLASDSLAGRRTGEIGCDKAAEYIAKEFKRIGLDVIDRSQTYLQQYEFSERQFDSTKKTPTKAANVVGFLKGSDKELSKQVVIIGAHYDHLGMGERNALDSVKSIHYGADDNASGTAGMLELAEYYAKHRKEIKRSLIFIAFSGEEEGLFGSIHYCKDPLWSLEKTQAMINMDMIGRLKDSVLIVEGMGSSPKWDALMQSIVKEKKPFRLRLKQSGTGPSDHSSFYRKQVPVLFFFTNFHKDYHRATDTKDKINYDGETQILNLVSAITKKVANDPTKYPYTVVAEDTTKKSTTFGVYVGGVPDYGYDGEGVKISEVTPGSPAAKAGLKGDDIIIKVGDQSIKNIYDYTAELSKHKPGNTTNFIVIRSGESVTIPLIFGSRKESHQ
ncbi:MAG TPA: M28 family peptidase [Candidatus Kapabacteria bacterium]|nr:M28 family peptidase [Candidatus Kapabacteria bacterium]